MKIIRISALLTMASFAVLASDHASAEGNSFPTPDQTSKDTHRPPKSALRRSYCFQRVGQLQSEPIQGETCDTTVGGASSTFVGPKRNTATISISSPSLEKIGIRSFAFLDNRGDGQPKFSSGVHVMEQILTYGVENPPLADRHGFVSDLSGKNALFSATSPDAAVLRSGGYTGTGYEIASAILTIDNAVDVPLEPSEGDMAAAAGMTIGRQYIEGTLTISLIPLASTGEQFGPTTFEFGTTMDWGSFK